MNELETQLAELVKKGIEVAETTGNFVIDQAPLLLQEFYRWHIIKNVFIIIAMTLVLLIIWKGFKALGKKEKPSRGYNNYAKIFGKYYEKVSGALILIYGIIYGGGTALAFLLISVYNIVFIITAPKLYLIEYFIR